MVMTNIPAAAATGGSSGSERSGFGTPLLGRADPPESQWAGRWINEEDVALSSGDDRDWFTLEQRMATFHEGVQRYQTARRRRRKLSSGFNFAQVMFVGDMGAKKSVAMGHEGYKWFQRGHPILKALNSGTRTPRTEGDIPDHETVCNPYQPSASGLVMTAVSDEYGRPRSENATGVNT